MKSTSPNEITDYICRDKKINGKIIIEVEERIPTYMLQCGENWAYINNQGYILEISENPMQLIKISDYETEEIIAGKRLNEKDLEKLDIVLEIMESAKSNGIAEKIQTIHINII